MRTAFSSRPWRKEHQFATLACFACARESTVNDCEAVRDIGDRGLDGCHASGTHVMVMYIRQKQCSIKLDTFEHLILNGFASTFNTPLNSLFLVVCFGSPASAHAVQGCRRCLDWETASVLSRRACIVNRLQRSAERL